uniref:Uncharacterized protein n=1 Tax=Anguilla anguilla TaxID=7936 RepID=A0A0E9V3R9_ANGAN
MLVSSLSVDLYKLLLTYMAKCFFFLRTDMDGSLTMGLHMLK